MMMMMMGSMSGTMSRHAGALAANATDPRGPAQPLQPHYGESPSVMHALEEARAAAAAAMTAADQARHQVARERRERQAVEDELVDIRDALAEEQRRRERAEHAAAVSFDDAEYARELLHEHAVASASAKVQSVRGPNGEGPNGREDATARATLLRAWRARRRLRSTRRRRRRVCWRSSRRLGATLEQQRHLQQAQGRRRRPCRRRRRGSRAATVVERFSRSRR